MMEPEHIVALGGKIDKLLETLHTSQVESERRFTRIETTLVSVTDALSEAAELSSRLTHLEANVKSDHEQSIGYRDVVNWAIGSGGLVAVGTLIYLLSSGRM